MWPENLSLAGRGLCLRAAGKHVPAGRIRCQSAEYKDRLGLGISAGFGGSEHTDSEARVSLGVRFEF